MVVKFSPAAAVTYSGTIAVNGDQTSGTNTTSFSGAGAATSLVPLAGIVTASGGARISGAAVTVVDGPNARRTTITTNGDYRFDNLKVGNANFSATASGYRATTIGVFVNGANTLNFALLVAPTPTGTPRQRVGARCNDGTSSSATGSGACSSHGGVRCWRYSDGACTNP